MSNNNQQGRDKARWLSNELAELRRLQKSSHITPRLPYSSVDDGQLTVTDSEGNVVDVVGPKSNPETGDQLVLPGPPPSKPSAPIVTAYLGTITANWDGSYTEDYVAPDLLQIEVHSSTDDDFEASAGTLIGTINGQRGGSVTLAVEYGTHYVRFIAVSTSGSRSEPSDIASVEVTPLVETIEMQEVLDDINARFDNIIIEAGDLPNRLDQLNLDLEAHNTRLQEAEAELELLNAQELTQLVSDLADAQTQIEQALTEVQTVLTDLEHTQTELDALKNTTIPALETQINTTKSRLTTAETGITQSQTRLTEAEADLTDAFGQINTTNTKVTNAQKTASDAQTAVDQAFKDLDNVWSTALRGFYWAGDSLNGVTTSSNSNARIVNVSDAPASSSVLRKDRYTGNVYWDSKPLPFDPNALYKITFKVRVVQDATDITNPVLYAGVHAWNAKATGGPGSRISTSGTVSTSGAHYFAAGSDPVKASDGWVTVVGYFQGLAPEGTSGGGERKDITNPGKMVAGTKYISPMALLDYQNGNGIWDVGMVAIDVVPAELQAQVVAAQAKADEAKARADAAHTAAGTAQSTADNALTMAGSKNKVFYSTSNPSGTASLGDTWRKVNASNDVIAEWRWTAGNTWLPQQITSEVISNLDVGKLTAGSAIINTAVVNKIAIQTADVIKLNASAITAGTISASRLNVTDLAARIATVIELNADSIVSGTIATGRLNATEVAAAVANVIQLNASKIVSGTVNTDRLNSNEIAARVATVIKLNASVITAGTIGTDRLNVNEIAAKTAAFQQVDVRNLFVTTGSFSEAVINTIWADVLHAKKITTDMMVVTAGGNLIVDPHFTDAELNRVRQAYANSTGSTGWYWAGSYWYSKAGLTDGTHTFPLRNTAAGSIYDDTIIEPGARYRIRWEAFISGTSATTRIAVRVKKRDGTTRYVGVQGTQSMVSGWKLYSNEWEPEEDDISFCPEVQFLSSTNVSRFAVRNISIVAMASGELIVDGAITALKIKTNAVESDKIKANAITADKIDVGAIEAQHIKAREITADKLRIGQGSNVFPDPLMEDAAGWPSSSTNVYTGGYGSSNRVRVTAGTGQTGGYYGNGADDVRRFPVVPGRSYIVSAWIRPTVNISVENCIAIYARLVKETGSGFTFTSPSAVSNSKDTTGVSTIAANTWVKMEGRIGIPSDATNTFIVPGLYLQSSFPTGSSCDFSNLNISEMTSGELIVEGSITGTHIKANSITASNIATNAITANELAANAVKAENIASDAITGKTITGGKITGASIVGSRYQFNGAGAGDGYDLRIENDTLGAYMGFSVPNGLVQGTIRAFDDDPWADYSTPALVIRPPSVSGKRDRDAVKISAGIDGGSGGLMDVGGNLWVRGEIRGRYQETNGTGRWTSLFINDVTNNYTGESPSIKSRGMYNREYSYASNVYITSNGYMGRSTSVRASKLAIEDVPQEQIEALLDVNPRWWFDKGDSERLAEYLTALEAGEVPDDLKDVPNDLTRIPGLIAEEVEEAGATAFVTYDRDELGNKKLSGVNYDRVGPALIPLVREQRDRISELESTLESVLARLDALENPVQEP